MRYKSLFYKALFIFFTLLSVEVYGQNLPNKTIDLETYEQGMELYNKGQYGLAQKYLDEAGANTFDEEREKRATAKYYAALCALYLYNGDAEDRVREFAKTFSLSPLVNQLYLTFAHNKFSLRRYRDAEEYYAKVNQYRLSPEDLSELQFKWGYALLENEKIKEAEKLFFKLKDKKSIFSSSAKYYYAHLLYTDSNYTQALTNFLPLQQDESFGPLVPYYLAHIYYRLGDYDKLLEVGEELVEDATPSRAPEIAKLMADAFYSKKDFNNTIKYLELYNEKGGRMLSTDNFELGYSYYQQQRYAAAIEYFNKITSGEESLRQNAYYHLADCYLKTDNKNQAQTAFKAASELKASATIREDAFFNYAKLSYELSDPYGDAITTLNQFMAEFPGSSRVNEINQYLANLYITTKDYDKAMLAIKRTGLDRIEMREVYQKIAFYRATELFNSVKYAEAIQKYSEALDYPINNTVTALSKYWRAESYYRLERYEKAAEEFTAFRSSNGAFALTEFNSSFYQSGYAYYMLEDYQKAAVDLRTFSRDASKKDPRLADAYLRMADAYLLTGGYLVAAEFYQNALNAKSNARDYAFYQRAICLGLAQKPDQKIAELQSLLKNYPSSVYAENAAFEVGNTQLQQEKYSDAIASFQDFVEDYPNSTKTADAQLSIGLAFRNTNRLNEAILVYRKVVKDYPGTEASIEAVGLARLAYQRNNDIDTYLDWVQGLSFVNYDQKTLDSTAYNTAFDQYSSDNCANAIGSFQNYLNRFPKGLFTLDANYYLATCAKKEKNTEAFIAAYQRILAFPKSQYTNEALQNLAYYHYGKAEYAEARKYYRQLANNAGAKGEQAKANAGIMRTAYKMDDANEAAVYADLIIATESTDADLLVEARRISALSKYKLGQLAQAKTTFVSLRTTTDGEIKAEAMYHIALIQHAEENYPAAKETINTLISELPSFKEYKIKTLLLLAKNYWRQNDIFQANYILDFVIKTDFSPQSVQKAKELKQQITDAEAQAMAKKQKQLEALNNPIKLEGDRGVIIIDTPAEEGERLQESDSTNTPN